ncbi:MAG TPA: hypothetical protein VMV20_00770, partial [Chitinophagaceae bacterium]|nr:hypothetical protein [Chitinophagaceae bacterium]
METILDKANPLGNPSFNLAGALDRSVRVRGIKSRLFHFMVISLTVLSTAPLIFILFYIFRQGIHAISWHFLVNIPRPVGEAGGGVGNAILGTVLLILVASVVAIPLGILVGIYLSQVARGRLAYWCRLAVDVLQGIPSIVIGIIIYEWVV